MIKIPQLGHSSIFQLILLIINKVQELATYGLQARSGPPPKVVHGDHLDYMELSLGGFAKCWICHMLEREQQVGLSFPAWCATNLIGGSKLSSVVLAFESLAMLRVGSLATMCWPELYLARSVPGAGRCHPTPSSTTLSPCITPH